MIQILKTIWSVSNALTNIVFSFFAGFIIIILLFVGMVFMAFQCGRSDTEDEKVKLMSQIRQAESERDSFFFVAQNAQQDKWQADQEAINQLNLRVKAENKQKEAEKNRDRFKDQLLVSQDSTRQLKTLLVSTNEELEASQLLVKSTQQENLGLNHQNTILAATLEKQAPLVKRGAFADEYLLKAKRYLLIASISVIFSMFLLLLALKIKYQTLSSSLRVASQKWSSTLIRSWQHTRKTVNDYMTNVFRTSP